jgi:X-Pro dipeptidyl-peptidase
MRLGKKCAAVLTAGALTLTLAPGMASAAGAGAAAAVSQPTYSYADAVRETVHVEAPVDGDRDGRNDRITADIIRPKETLTGLKVPVIFMASPYFAPEASSLASTDPRYRAAVEDGYKDADDDGTPTKFPGWYDNYFVPRGYAVVFADMPGTRYSEGCASVDGREEVAGVKAVLDWLDGRAKGYDKAGRQTEADWDNGRAGMIGKSHPGILANLVATLDVPNLKTIIPISAMASWYTYQRNNGLTRFADYPRWTARSDGANSKLGANRCDAVYDEIAAASDEQNATYNAFWAERDYRKAAKNVKASVLMVHGINDWNVTTDGANDWWQALAASGVPRKLWLTQEAHVDPIQSHPQDWVPQLHRWLDQWLLGVDTGVLNDPPVRLERAPDQWAFYPSWPSPGTAKKLWLSDGLTETPPPSGGTATTSFTEKYEQTQTEMITNPEVPNANRAVFLSQPLTADTRMSGVTEVTVRAKASVSGTPLSALLVDFGTDSRIFTDEEVNASGVSAVTGAEDCYGPGVGADTGCLRKYKHDIRTTPAEVVTKVQMDTENRTTLETDVPVRPDTYYTYTLKLQPEDYVFKPGHRIGIVLAGTNCTGTEVPGTEWCSQAPAPGTEPWGRTTFEVDLNNSFVTLPVAR